MNAGALIGNQDPHVVTLCAFIGAKDSRQSEPFEAAVSKLIRKYSKIGIEIRYDKFNNDQIRSELHYSPTDAVNRMLRADIHLMPTHFHQGNLQGDIHPEWNMNSINLNLDRLEFHLGIPMGKKIHCPVNRQDKARIYSALSALSVPTIAVDLVEGVHNDIKVISAIDEYVNFF